MATQPAAAPLRPSHAVSGQPNPIPRLLRIARWLLPLAALLTLAGYFGPWVNHRVAGLVIMGLDLGEYVKFLPPVRSGEVTIWRAGFYWPLFTVSLSQSLYAFRAELRYAWWLRAVMLGVAAVAALNLLPPAWTPARLLTPEFHEQGAGIAIALAALAFSPFLALLPRRITAVLLLIGCGLAIWIPTRDFLRVLPAISKLYNHALHPGWGLYVCGAGLVLLAASALLTVMAPAGASAGIDRSDR